MWLCDLLDLQNLSRTNHGKKWILLVIDVFTRRAFGIAMNNKEAGTVLDAFKEVTEDEGVPRVLLSDNGHEFDNRSMNAYLKENNVTHVTNEPQYHPTLGIIDRLSRTIKEKIYKQF